MPAPKSIAPSNAASVFSGISKPECRPRWANPREPGSRGSGPDGDDRIHFNCNAERKDRNANGAPRMTAGLAEDFLHQLARAVGDLRLIGERGCAVDEHAELHDSLHSIERTERGLHLREQHHAAAASSGDSAVEIDVITETAFDQTAIFGEADLAGDV